MFLPKATFLSIRVIDRIFQALLCFVLVASCYRRLWKDSSDIYKCRALLNAGRWLDTGGGLTSQSSFQNWQPPGCIMYEYSKKDIQECFQQQRLVFIGDSTTRQIFWALAKKLDRQRAEEEMSQMSEPDLKHSDLEFISNGVTTQFVWDPWLNSTGLKNELRNLKADATSEYIGNASAGLITLGAPGLWYARYEKNDFLAGFKDSIDYVIPFVNHSMLDFPILPRSKDPRLCNGPANPVFLTPVQTPHYQFLSPRRQATMTPQKIDQMNEYLENSAIHNVVWSHHLMTRTGPKVYEESGLHVNDKVALHKVDVLLNLRCNAYAASRGHPFDKTCCSNYANPTWFQIAIAFATRALPAFILAPRKQSSQKIVNAFAVLISVVFLCYHTDRTHFFEKEQKQFKESEFLAACLAVVTVGIISLRRNTVANSDPRSIETSFLSRDQTDEIKGWMQAIVLIYHYTHGSRKLWVYQLARVLVAFYLFLTGFGHTLYFLRTGDYSLRRVATVLVRLNLLSCILPHMMQTDYLFYYFAPLASFWFIVIYFTLKIGHQNNSSLSFLMWKIFLSAVYTTTIVKVSEILEIVSFMLKHCCAISWNVAEWRFRTSLDMYIVFVGMVAAMIYFHIPAPTSSYQSINFDLKALKLLMSSLAFLFRWYIFVQSFPDKQTYNQWHPYISFVPILCFIGYRNYHIVFRSCHSAAFAWLGRCSLETYILQYHIWLAADTTGLLRIGLWGRWTEAAILTPLFLWISWHTAKATQTLTNWIVNGNNSPSTNRSSSPNYTLEKMNSSCYLSGTQECDSIGSKETAFSLGRLSIFMRPARLVINSMEDLRLRLALICLILWVGNISYKLPVFISTTEIL